MAVSRVIGCLLQKLSQHRHHLLILIKDQYTMDILYQLQYP